MNALEKFAANPVEGCDAFLARLNQAMADMIRHFNTARTAKDKEIFAAGIENYKAHIATFTVLKAFYEVCQ